MKTIYLTTSDIKKLRTLVQTHRSIHGAQSVDALSKGLKNAKEVSSDKIPKDIVTMNSMVRLINLNSTSEIEVSIVFPKDADLTQRKISVLAPVATAVLGCKVGDEVVWASPQGSLTYKIEEIIYQPEAAGHMHL